MGMHKGTPTLWAVTDPDIVLNVFFKIIEDGQEMTINDTDNYNNSFIDYKSGKGYHLINILPKEIIHE